MDDIYKFQSVTHFVFFTFKHSVVLELLMGNFAWINFKP